MVEPDDDDKAASPPPSTEAPSGDAVPAAAAAAATAINPGTTTTSSTSNRPQAQDEKLANGDGKLSGEGSPEADEATAGALSSPPPPTPPSEAGRPKRATRYQNNDTTPEAAVKDAKDTTTTTTTTPNDNNKDKDNSKEEEEQQPEGDGGGDPYVGHVVVQTKVLATTGQIAPLAGDIVAVQEASGRIPRRWTVEWKGDTSTTTSQEEEKTVVCFHDEWTESDLLLQQHPEQEQPTTAASLPTGNHQLQWALDQIQTRYQEQVELELELGAHSITTTTTDPRQNPILSKLILYAAMEEALQTNLANAQYQQQDEQQEGRGGGSTDNLFANAIHPPQYYSTNPSTYLKAPTATDTTATEPEQKVFLTPSSLAHRVRTGCQWAHKYWMSQQPPLPPLPPPPVSSLYQETSTIHSTHRRSSLRQPKPPPPPPMVPKPTPVQPGGRVALWWIEQLEEMAAGKSKENEEDEHNFNTITTKDEKVKEEEEEEEEEQPQQDDAEPAKQKGDVKNEEEISLEQEEPAKGDDESSKSKPTQTKDEGKTKKKNKKDSAAAAAKCDENGGDDSMEVDDEGEDDDGESDNNDNDDDEDYGSKDAIEEHEEDEDLEDVEKEHKGNLSPVASDDDEPMEEGDEDAEEEDEDEVEQEETEEDIQQAVLYHNPYLKPTFPSFLEYLAKPKAFTGEDVQKAMADVILRIKFNKRSSAVGLETSTLSTVDQIVLDQETPDYPPGKVVLKCVSDETYSELQKMEAQAFSRCKFALDVIGEEESSMQTQRKEELILQEIEFKEQKAWSKWRHKGIHEGYATWPSWHDAIAAWVKANCTVESTSLSDPGSANNNAAAASSNSQTTPQVDDEALAKSLEDQESEGMPSGRRRTTARRAAATASEGVFYGNQSQLTQKQLMDALIRLVKTNQCMTLLRLQSLVAEDSSDPIRRTRVALGKLVWKRNLILRKSMDADLSDSDLLKSVVRRPLLTIPPAVVTETVEETTATVEDATATTTTTTTEIATNTEELSEEEKGLINYIQSLHATELRLRRMVTKHLAEIPVTIIATAADERAGSMESMDATDFEDPSMSGSIEWYTSGHDLLKKVIFRPAVANGNSTDMTPCFWYEIQDYSKSIESDADDKDEPESKERRMRFRAIPIPPPGESWAEQEQILLLTEAQVQAGLKAAELEKKHRANKVSDGNPFSEASGDRVTLIPLDGEEETSKAGGDIHGRIVGYDNVVVDDDDDEVEYRILILPELGDSSREAFWASLDVRADTSSYVCQPVGESTTWYTIEQFDFHPGSEAYQQCESVLQWLIGHGKAGPFLDPVDPVALKIPTYPDVIKNPMDLSTMAEKLENGQYSSILPGQTVGISPVSRMLNGPFRKDIDLIFDNAMLFNPPDDWIYKAAAQLKKSFVKKIADLSQAADKKAGKAGGRLRTKKSVYLDEDSDVDMYEYESDNDEDFGRKAASRKRKRGSARGGAQKDEFAARAIEHTIRLQNTLRDASNLRGPFANLPINSSASSFTLPPRWSCRPSTGTAAVATPPTADTKTEENAAAKKRAQELSELLQLQKVVEANESAGLRRSTRAHDAPSSTNNGRSSKSKGGNSSIEYFVKDMALDNNPTTILPSTRYELEIHAEKLHEDYYSKLYQSYANLIMSSKDEEEENGGSNKHPAYGVYSNGSFPPYMGRVVPISSWEEVSWEIRSPFVVAALRWVLRGLIRSGHLTAIEDMNADLSSGIVLTNDIYYWDASLQPYEILDLRELQRKKRANKEDLMGEDSEDEVEMSEYEKARAERVARNAERLKALGLA